MDGQAVACDLRPRLAQMLPELRAFARFLAGSRAEADDLVQEALLRALRSLDGSGEQPAELRTWCLAIVRNVFHEHRRARRREVTGLSDSLPEPALPAPQHVQGDVRDLSRALGRLPPLLREAIVLVGAQGLDYGQAAAVAGVPVGTMKARVSRARAQLGHAVGKTIATP